MRKTILSFILILALTFTWIPGYASNVSVSGIATPPASETLPVSYMDIMGHWAENAIKLYADQTVFADKDGRFLPSKHITRSEFVMMLHKALGINIQYLVAINIKDYYSDVKNGDSYTYALYDLATMGIIDYRGTFRPNETLPRDEMVHIIMNALKNKLGGNLPVNNKMPIQFKDDGKIAQPYKSDVYRALLLSLVYGRGDNVFDPKTGTTRAESAMMMARLVKEIQILTAKVDIEVSTVATASDLTMNLNIRNNTLAPVVFNYTSGQKYDFALLDVNKIGLYRWSADKLFLQALSSETLAPGQSFNYSEVLSGDTYLGIKGKVAYLQAFITGKSNTFNINADGYEIPIKK